MNTSVQQCAVDLVASTKCLGVLMFVLTFLLQYVMNKQAKIKTVFTQNNSAE